MDDDQQFCLRWNNHQSTLISVFDTLLENGTLVDCTLAAEGKFLKAHKVVLSACSPYFAALLSQQYDKHPIFILKDVKFQELRAMMDYMYRGEVNISQDQLAALLKAAESLQIKGLSDSRGSGGSGGSGGSSSQKADTSTKLHASVPAAKQTSTGLTIEQKRPRIEKHPATIDMEPDVSDSREGSTSPNSRKRKKVRRRSIETNNIGDNHDQHSNSSSHSMPHAASSTHSTSMPTITSATSSASVLNVTKKTDHHQSHESKGDIERDVDDNGDDGTDGGDGHHQQPQIIHARGGKQASGGDSDSSGQQVLAIGGSTVAKDKMEHSTHQEMLLEPKNEYDESNEGNVEDLTLDDEELLDDLEQAGPSHGGEGSSQGYAQWQIERSQDEVFMGGQDSSGQHRDAQEQLTCTPTLQFLQNNDPESQRFFCNVCDKSYLRKRHLQRHMRDECIGIPPRFNCSLCPSKFRRKYHLVRHLNSKHGIVTPKMEPSGNSSGPESSGGGGGMNNGSLQEDMDMYNRAISLIVPKKEVPTGGEAQHLEESMEIYNRFMNFEKLSSLGGLGKKDDGGVTTEGATLADSIEIYNRLMNFDKYSAGAALLAKRQPIGTPPPAITVAPIANRLKRKSVPSPLPEDFQMKMNIQFKAAEIPSASIKSPQLSGSTQPQKFVPNDMQ